VQVLRAEAIRAAIQEQPLQHADGLAGEFGLGYQLLWKIYPGLGTQAFGHTGLGGSIGLADPTSRLGFGYVVNQLGNSGAAHLLTATYRSLGA
jgi:CubicO group peptidase (beta-lactamase class C family)